MCYTNRYSWGRVVCGRWGPVVRRSWGTYSVFGGSCVHFSISSGVLECVVKGISVPPFRSSVLISAGSAREGPERPQI